MFGNGELTRLAARKAELLAESRAHREALIADCTRLQPVITLAENISSVVRRVLPLCLVAAPLLGFWAARKGTGGFWGKLQSGWRLWQTISELWKGFRQ